MIKNVRVLLATFIFVVVAIATSFLAGWPTNLLVGVGAALCWDRYAWDDWLWEEDEDDVA